MEFTRRLGGGSLIGYAVYRHAQLWGSYGLLVNNHVINALFLRDA